MTDQEDARLRMRASDRERQEVVDILKAALDDGRLKMDEYVDRMGKAYEALTHGELALLHDDLPAGPAPRAATTSSASASASAWPAGSASPAVETPRGAFASLPTALKVLWTIWFIAVSINVVVWVLLGMTSGSIPYPWPLWVAGPSGTALFGVSVGVRAIRRGEGRPAPKQIPPG